MTAQENERCFCGEEPESFTFWDKLSQYDNTVNEFFCVYCPKEKVNHFGRFHVIGNLTYGCTEKKVWDKWNSRMIKEKLNDNR